MHDRSAPRRSPLAGLSLGQTSSSVSLSDPGAMTRLVLRGNETVAKQAGLALGLPIPLEACRSATRDGRAALWLGPDEWLLIAPLEQGAAVAEKLGEALARVPHALVDVSHRNAALAIEGPGAAAALNAGCPLDLDATGFPTGMCTRTLLGKAEIVLWRNAAQSFRLEVWRSFVAYVHLFLVEAARNLPREAERSWQDLIPNSRTS